MKKNISFISVFIFGCLFLSCKCKNAFEFADLVVDGVEQSFSDNNDTRTYSIIHKILNTVEDITCPDAVALAEEHTNQVPIMYSPNGDFNNSSQVVQTKSFEAQRVPANESYSMVSEIVFNVDGFYQIVANLDVNNQVEERSEDNNNSTNSVGGTIGKTFRNAVIVEVRNSGNRISDFSSDAKVEFIKSWNIRLEK